MLLRKVLHFDTGPGPADECAQEEEEGREGAVAHQGTAAGENSGEGQG